MGARGDKVEYRIGDEEWRTMRYTPGIDPNYWVKLMEWDFTEELLPGRRPSNPVASTHLWSGTIRLDLSPGEHTIEVRATDRYGNTHFGKKDYTILE